MAAGATVVDLPAGHMKGLPNEEPLPPVRAAADAPALACPSTALSRYVHKLPSLKRVDFTIGDRLPYASPQNLPQPPLLTGCAAYWYNSRVLSLRLAANELRSQRNAAAGDQSLRHAATAQSPGHSYRKQVRADNLVAGTLGGNRRMHSASPSLGGHGHVAVGIGSVAARTCFGFIDDGFRRSAGTPVIGTY